MSEMSDLLPGRDNTYDLGSSASKWYALYCLYLSDGTVTRQVNDLATREDYTLMSRLPTLTAEDDGKFLTVHNRQFDLSVSPPGVLPPVSVSDNGKYLVSRGGNWIAAYMPVLPVVTITDNDSILRVVDGMWSLQPAPQSLPTVSVMDNGKILQVYLGRWSPVAPPSDVLPPVNEGDHGSVLVAENENTGWNKWMLGRATHTRDGLVPKLPAVKNRVLMGDNTWAAAPTGASGQWVIGDIRHTLKHPGYGWESLATGFTITPGADETYKALYLAAGKTEADWTAGTVLTIPAMADCYVRFMPDTVASVNFGITMELQPATGPTHIELELYRHPADTNVVLQANTYFKVKTDYRFEASALTFNSSAPGFFVEDGPMWRLFKSEGETITDRVVVMFDTGEACLGEGVREIVAAGGYYYRWRQVDNGVGRDWQWNRILTTGGLNREEAQIVKLCDVFATGRLQKWKSPAVAVTMYAVSEAGMDELYSDENDLVEVDTKLRAGSRLSLVGHGNLKMTGDADRMDMFAVFPQYTAVEQEDFPPAVTPMVAYRGPYTSLFGYTCSVRGVTKIVDSYNEIGKTGLVINNTTYAQDSNDAYYGLGVINNNYRLFYGVVDDVERPIMIPDRQGGLYYDTGADRTCFSGLWKSIPESTYAGWDYPFFTGGHYINGRNFLIPGEAPGIWDCDGEVLLPFPENTIFKGGPAQTIGPDGCIYAMPRFTNSDITRTRSTGMLKFDPFSMEISFVPLPWELVAVKTDNYGWWKAITLKDGRILFVPYGEANFVIYDVRYQSITRTTFGQTLPDDFKWANAGVLADGTVVGIGTDADGRGSLSFRFFPDTTSLEMFTFSYPLTKSLRTLVAMPDGSLLGAAFELIANNVRLYRIKSGEPKYTPGTYSPYINKV